MDIVFRKMADLARSWCARCPLAAPFPRFSAHRRASRSHLSRLDGALCAASACHAWRIIAPWRHWPCTANHGDGAASLPIRRDTSTTCKRPSPQHGQRPMSMPATRCMNACTDSTATASGWDIASATRPAQWLLCIHHPVMPAQLDEQPAPGVLSSHCALLQFDLISELVDAFFSQFFPRRIFLFGRGSQHYCFQTFSTEQAENGRMRKSSCVISRPCWPVARPARWPNKMK
jgi:hypothetical protein